MLRALPSNVRCLQCYRLATGACLPSRCPELALVYPPILRSLHSNGSIRHNTSQPLQSIIISMRWPVKRSWWNLEVAVFWGVIPCNLVENYKIFERNLLPPSPGCENGVRRFLRKGSNFIPHIRESHTKRDYLYLPSRIPHDTYQRHRHMSLPGWLSFKHRDSVFRWNGYSLLGFLRTSAETWQFTAPVNKFHYEKCTMCVCFPVYGT
jgi:hypothetical protein